VLISEARREDRDKGRRCSPSLQGWARCANLQYSGNAVLRPFSWDMILVFSVWNGRVNLALPLALFLLSTVPPALYDWFHSAPQHLEWELWPQAQGSLFHWQGPWILLSDILVIVLPALAFYGMFTLLSEAQSRGWSQGVSGWLSRNIPGFRAALQHLETFGRRLNGPGGNGNTDSRYEQRFSKLTEAIQKSPTEVYKTREDLMQMGVCELKALMRARNLPVAAVSVEKSDLVDCVMSSGGSTGETCSICMDAYESGAVLRRLSCGHKYHLECVDRWALSSLDYTRDPACPSCNASLFSSK